MANQLLSYQVIQALMTFILRQSSLGNVVMMF